MSLCIGCWLTVRVWLLVLLVVWLLPAVNSVVALFVFGFIRFICVCGLIGGLG